MPVRHHLGLAYLYVVLIASVNLALAALQNVTVDDAILTGLAVPQYLPFASTWNQGNACPECLAKPDPALAYNGTWHDATFQPGSTISQAIAFTFTGSALYVFFILANTVPGATTLTGVSISLDEETVGTFLHVPSASTAYEYNVLVYANTSVPFGKHNMIIEPVNMGYPVLMLFDYLVYTTDTDATTTGVGSVSVSATAGVQGTSSGRAQNAAAIVGGTLGGLAALILAATSLVCYRRHKRGRGQRLRRGSVLGSFFSLRESLAGTPSGIWHSETRSTSDPHTSPVTPRPSSLAISVDPPSTASLSPHPNLAIQIELLRDEISRLYHLKNYNPY